MCNIVIKTNKNTIEFFVRHCLFNYMITTMTDTTTHNEEKQFSQMLTSWHEQLLAQRAFRFRCV